MATRNWKRRNWGKFKLLIHCTALQTARRQYTKLEYSVYRHYFRPIPTGDQLFVHDDNDSKMIWQEHFFMESAHLCPTFLNFLSWKKSGYILWSFTHAWTVCMTPVIYLVSSLRPSRHLSASILRASVCLSVISSSLYLGGGKLSEKWPICPSPCRSWLKPLNERGNWDVFFFRGPVSQDLRTQGFSQLLLILFCIEVL